MIRSLFKRSLSHFSGLVLGKILTTAVFIFLARVLMPDKFGQLLFFVTITQLVTVLADFGLKQWFQKHANLLNRSQVFGLAIEARLLSGTVAILILTMVLIVFQPFTVVLSILMLAVLVTEALLSLAEAYHLELGHATRVGLRNPSVMAVFFVGFALTNFSSSLNVLLTFWFFGSLLTAAWFFPWAELKRISTLSISRALQTLKESSDYALLTAASLVYAKGDQLIVERVAGSLSLGLYGAAYRYLDALSLLPSALTQNLFPLSAKAGQVSFKQLVKITIIMTVAGTLFSGLMLVSADFLITDLLGSAYSDAIPALQIFSLVLGLFFINAPLATVVQSSSLVKDFLPFGILNTLTNIVLNLILVPVLGFTASAWIMVVTEATGLVINLIFVYRVYND